MSAERFAAGHAFEWLLSGVRQPMRFHPPLLCKLPSAQVTDIRPGAGVCATVHFQSVPVLERLAAVSAREPLYVRVREAVSLQVVLALEVLSALLALEVSFAEVYLIVLVQSGWRAEGLQAHLANVWLCAFVLAQVDSEVVAVLGRVRAQVAYVRALAAVRFLMFG